MKKRKVLVVALIVALVAILSAGSLAWFTDKDFVQNTLIFADDFKIDVYETDETGAAITSGDETVGRTYTGIMPGDTIHKDPTVWNNGNHPEWVRVHVTLDNYAVWADCVEEGTDLTELFGGFDSNAWTRFDSPEVKDDKVTYTFYLNYQLGANEKYTLFNSVKIPGELTSEQAEEIGAAGFNIWVEAEAIQVENLPADVTTAQQAFDRFAD